MDCRSSDELLVYSMLIVDLCIYRTPVTYRIAAQVVILEVSNVHACQKWTSTEVSMGACFLDTESGEVHPPSHLGLLPHPPSFPATLRCHSSPIILLT